MEKQNKMDKYHDLVKRIIEEQKLIMGPLAFELAKRTEGLKFENELTFNIEGEPKNVVTNLINQYKELFGDISVQVSRHALLDNAKSFTNEELPELLI
jgi:hypothetical protein